MLVTIVAVPNADNSGIDINRVEKVENIPAEVARQMVDLGTARLPSEDELEAYREAQIAEVDRQVAEAETEAPGARDSSPDPDAAPTPPATTARTSKKTTTPATAEPPVGTAPDVA